MRSTRAPLLEMYRMMGRSGQDCGGKGLRTKRASELVSVLVRSSDV